MQIKTKCELIDWFDISVKHEKVTKVLFLFLWNLYRESGKNGRKEKKKLVVGEIGDLHSFVEISNMS